MGAAHRIGRLRLRLRAPDRARFEAASRTFEDRFESEVVSALEAALDELGRNGEIVRIDRLELDLGEIDPRSPRLGERLRAAVDRALRLRLPARDAPLPHAGGARVAAPAPTTDGTAAELARFLETGTLPWPEPGTALAEIARAARTLPRPELARLARALIAVVTHAAGARRLLSQLPIELTVRLAAALGGSEPRAVEPSRFLTDEEAASLLPLLQAVGASGGGVAEAQALATALEHVVHGDAPSVADTESREAADAMPPPVDRAETPGPGRSFESLPVTAAGAVLLHPFLGAYFETLGLAVAGVFPDAAARERAVLLGHHAATGEESPAEPDCVLMKVLCGHPVHAPLTRVSGIDDVVRAEADDLLRAVVRHWGRLGRTSPAGLREGFLHRPGVLTSDDDGLVLRVERRSIDVLLDHLPWTLSHVRTPFMDRVLRVEWTA